MYRLVVVLSAAAALLAQGLPPARQADIERLITQEMSRQSIPGISVAVAAGGGDIVWSNGYGFSDLENYVPAKAATVYRLGSISKPITAVAVLELWEAGKLDLDAPIQRYVPSFPKKEWPVSARQLLAHLGGVRHYENLEEINSTRHYTDLAAPLKIFQDDPLVAEPGTKFNYTTFGYVLLGAAVEGASSMRYMEYLRQRIFAPAGMDHMRADHVYAIIPNRARGYSMSGSGQIQNCNLADTSNKIPGGGLSSTADDLVRFVLALRKHTLLKHSTDEMMFSPQKLKDGRVSNYGLGWNISALDGRKQVSHGGGQQGVTTLLAMLPADGVAVALMCNLEKAELREVSNRIARVLLEVPAPRKPPASQATR